MRKTREILRLKWELGPGRTWVMGYANDVMAYVPSLRVLKEGGYEGGGAMVYYDLPGPFRSGLEDMIVAAVHDLLGQRFPPVYDSQRTAGSRALSPFG